MTQRTQDAVQLIIDAVEAWPELDTDAAVSGADLLEWFAKWRQEAKAFLAADYSN